MKKIDDEIRQMQNDIVVQPDKTGLPTEDSAEESNGKGSGENSGESPLHRKGDAYKRYLVLPGMH